MSIEAWTETLPGEALLDLEPREWRDEEADAYCGLLDAHHYLGCPDARVRHLSQVVLYEGKAVALLIWTTCSRKLAGREHYVGWDPRTREKRLGWVVQNSRFLLIPQSRPANLASRLPLFVHSARTKPWTHQTHCCKSRTITRGHALTRGPRSCSGKKRSRSESRPTLFAQIREILRPNQSHQKKSTTYEYGVRCPGPHEPLELHHRD
jgi:hypothetical protein